MISLWKVFVLGGATIIFKRQTSTGKQFDDVKKDFISLYSGSLNYYWRLLKSKGVAKELKRIIINLFNN